MADPTERPAGHQPAPGRRPARGAPWGSVARRGAHVLDEEREAAGPKAAADAARERARYGRRSEETEVWVDEGRVEETEKQQGRRRPRSPRADVAPAALRRRRAPRSEEGLELTPEVRAELEAAASDVSARRVARLATMLAEATDAYAGDRYEVAARLARAVAADVPGSAAARELLGLACYRMGRYREAARHLEALGPLVDDVDQLPVLMDCYRALGRPRKVEELWDRLRRESPHADVLVEGRLVLVAALADADRLDEAVDLLVRAGAGRELHHPHLRHLRQWYVLADLAERAGDLPRARELFARVVRHDPDLADAAARLDELGRAVARARRPSRRRGPEAGHGGSGPQAGGGGGARKGGGPRRA